MKCKNCDIDIKEGEEILQDEEVYCQACFDENFFECVDCKEICSTDESQQNNDGDWVCQSCFDDDYFICSDCDRVAHNDNAITTGDSSICEHCYSESYCTCNSCDAVIHNDDSHYCESCDHNYCSDCNCGCYDDSSEFYNYQELSTEPRRGKKSNIIKIDRLVGVEIESESPNEFIKLPSYFGICEDGSLTNGVEVQTPPSSLIELENVIKLATNELNTCGCSVSSNCGLHIHIETKDFTIKELMNFLKIYKLVEDLYFSLVSKSRRSNTYCKRLPIDPFSYGNITTEESLMKIWYEKDNYQLFEDIELGKMKLNNDDWRDDEKMERLKALIKRKYKTGKNKKFFDKFKKEKCNSSRYSAINLHSHFFRGTIEFRHHQGTLNFEKIIRWIDFNLSIIDYAKNNFRIKDLYILKEQQSPLKKLRELSKIIKLNKKTLNFFEKRLKELN